jgi:hypothetical protein
MSDTPVYQPPLQYGGVTFIRASRLVRTVLYGTDDGKSAESVRKISDMAALATLLTRLPRLPVELSSSAQGQRIAGHLRRRKWGIPKNRIAQSVLPLPPTVEEYLRGRPRHALRTNLRKARAEGMTCQRLDSVAERRSILDRLQAETAIYPDDEWWAALDSSGEPIGAAAVTIDVQWAMLTMLVTRAPGCGWLLHSELVETLCRAGVRHVSTHPLGALPLAPNLQYFQRVLGYRVVNLRAPRVVFR